MIRQARVVEITDGEDAEELKRKEMESEVEHHTLSQDVQSWVKRIAILREAKVRSDIQKSEAARREAQQQVDEAAADVQAQQQQFSVFNDQTTLVCG